MHVLVARDTEQSHAHLASSFFLPEDHRPVGTLYGMVTMLCTYMRYRSYSGAEETSSHSSVPAFRGDRG